MGRKLVRESTTEKDFTGFLMWKEGLLNGHYVNKSAIGGKIAEIGSLHSRF
jgi:hypothetical protein